MQGLYVYNVFFVLSQFYFFQILHFFKYRIFVPQFDYMYDAPCENRISYWPIIISFASHQAEVPS